MVCVTLLVCHTVTPMVCVSRWCVCVTPMVYLLHKVGDQRVERALRRPQVARERVEPRARGALLRIVEEEVSA